MSSKFGNLTDAASLTPDRQAYVTELFDNLAPDYDRFNRYVSLFRDEAWRRRTIALLKQAANGKVLDLASGTGDLARCALNNGSSQVHLLDISHNMLRLAAEKLTSEGHTSFITELGSADAIPIRRESIDGVVSGFAMRNVFHFLDDVLAEIYRILKPHGRFAILELSQPQNSLLKTGFRLHMKTVVPLIGMFVTGSYAPFKYLSETTLSFLPPKLFSERLTRAGFVDVKWQSFLFGGIAIHHGTKPR